MSDWDRRYREGRVRCRGSTGPLKRWKHRTIETYVGPIAEASVIDVGCGDARFWTWTKKPRHYAGIDGSLTAITKAMRVLPNARMYNVDAGEFIPSLVAPVVLAIDLVFHLMDRPTVEATLTNLTRYSTGVILVYTWVNSPGPYDESFQCYWNMDDFEEIFTEDNFKRVALARNKHDRIGGMYVYKKVGLLK